jgi:hypothetical protein
MLRVVEKGSTRPESEGIVGRPSLLGNGTSRVLPARF